MKPPASRRRLFCGRCDPAAPSENIDAGEMRSRRCWDPADLKDGRPMTDKSMRLAAITALPSLVPLLARRAERRLAAR
jgi:hypothetical protein